MEFKNDGFEFVDIPHAVVSTKSATLQLVSAAPAAIAGVVWSILWLSVSDENSFTVTDNHEELDLSTQLITISFDALFMR
jgi:hypothetical protein